MLGRPEIINQIAFLIFGEDDPDKDDQFFLRLETENHLMLQKHLRLGQYLKKDSLVEVKSSRRHIIVGSLRKDVFDGHKGQM